MANMTFENINNDIEQFQKEISKVIHQLVEQKVSFELVLENHKTEQGTLFALYEIAYNTPSVVEKWANSFDENFKRVCEAYTETYPEEVTAIIRLD